ncbi:MAG: hypothetical protein ACRD0N_10310 [Acidimicrobiales bacterium]
MKAPVRALGVAVVSLATASVAALLVVPERSEEARRDRLDEQDRLNALAADRREEARAEEEARAAAEDPAGELPEFLDRLVEASGGDGEGGGLVGGLLEDCGDAISDATEDGGPGFFERGGSAGPDQQLREVAAVVERLRGLRFRDLPDPVYLSQDDLAQRVRDLSVAEVPPGSLEADSRALVALGVLPPGSDLREILLESVGEMVAGFYDPDTRELVVLRTGQGRLDGFTRTVLAHELDHALTDQVHGLPPLDATPPPGEEDKLLAGAALVEGDATLLMQQYLVGHVPFVEQVRALSAALGGEVDVAALPYQLQRELAFPYLEGLEFACNLHARGGWAAVDRAYRVLPTTTAQVLFPDRYRAGEGAVDARDPGAAGASWEPAPTMSLGAAQLQWLFEAPGGDPDRSLDDPLGRAAAWAGGELRVWADGERTALGVALVQRAGERPLCASMASWYAAAFPDARAVDRREGEELAFDGASQDAVVRCAGTEVRLGIAPDLATARALAA